MEPLKLALISPSDYSPWQSCRSIQGNLFKLYESYQKTYPEHQLHYFAWPKFSPNHEWEETLDEILRQDFTHIILAFSSPSPLHFIKILAHKIHSKTIRPEIILHLYGCFSSWAQELAELPLEHLKLKLVVPSKAQQGLIAQCFPQGSLFVCPFPLPSERFRYKKEERKKFKSELLKRLKLSPDSQIILYTGRAHPQKNLDLLLSEVQQINTPKLSLLFCGSYDDHADSRLKLNPAWHSSFQRINTLKKQGRFYELGPCSEQEIDQYYLGADLFASLSTYHDEDFGMSPLEALSLGTGALLSFWGGYQGFASKATRFQKIHFKENELYLELESFSYNVSELLNLSDEEKEASVTEMKAQFSCEALLPTLKKILLSQAFVTSADQTQIQNYHQGFDYRQDLSSYQKLYQSYWETHGHQS